MRVFLADTVHITVSEMVFFSKKYIVLHYKKPANKSEVGKTALKIN
jgi:hypothetical protein